jgi:hypothetical protein
MFGSAFLKIYVLKIEEIDVFRTQGIGAFSKNAGFQRKSA